MWWFCFILFEVYLLCSKATQGFPLYELLLINFYEIEQIILRFLLIW